MSETPENTKSFLQKKSFPYQGKTEMLYDVNTTRKTNYIRNKEYKLFLSPLKMIELVVHEYNSLSTSSYFTSRLPLKNKLYEILFSKSILKSLTHISYNCSYITQDDVD